MKDPARPESSLLKIATWYALLFTVGAHGLGGLAEMATDYLLKDRLGLGPEARARYGAILAAFSYVAFLFGYARDRWVAKIGGDRNLMALGAGGVVLSYAFLASAEPTYGRLLAASLGAVVAVSFLYAARDGAFVRFGVARAVTDRLSAFDLALGSLVASLLAVTAGWAAANVAYRPLVGLTALLGLAYVGLLFVAPRGAFPATTSEERGAADRSIVAAFVALVRSRPFLAALGLAFAFNFGPASETPFFYYVADHLKVDAELLGRYRALLNLAPLPVAVLYGAYARRTNLRNRLTVGMILVLAGTFLYFALEIKAVFLPLAVLFGISNAVYLAASGDLLLRAMPKGAEGFGFAIYGTFVTVVQQASNLIGARVYEAHGYAACIWLTLPAAALGLPLLALVPREPQSPEPIEEPPPIHRPPREEEA